MVLEQERAYFEANKSDLLRHHKDQFAVIKGQRLVGTYTTFDEALSAGVKAVGTEAFLIKQVQEGDGVIQYPALQTGLLNVRP